MNLDNLTIEQLETLKLKVNAKLTEINSADKVVIWNYERNGTVSRYFTTFEAALAYYDQDYKDVYKVIAQRYEEKRGGYQSVWGNCPKLVPELLSPKEFQEYTDDQMFEDINPTKY